MKEHSIVIVGSSTSSPLAAGEIRWEPSACEQYEADEVNRPEERQLRRSISANLGQKIDRACKITPRDAMMMQQGELSSSSSNWQEQDELQDLVRRSMDLTVDEKGFYKPTMHKDTQHPQKQSSSFLEETLEMHESIESMMSFSVSDLIQDVEEDDCLISERRNRQDDAHDKSLQESMESIVSVSYSKLIVQQHVTESVPSKLQAVPSNTKSFSTLTTAAMSKSSRDDSQDLHDLVLENSVVGEEGSFQNQRNSMLTNSSKNGLCFQTPSRSRQRFPVPQSIFSPRGALVSPLSTDPSPGHTKMSMHTELMKKVKGSRDKTFRSAGEFMVSPPARVLPYVLEGSSSGSQCSSPFLSVPVPLSNDRTAMDSFESLDFVPDPLGPYLEDNDDEDETLDGEEIFVVDSSSITVASTASPSVGSRASSVTRPLPFSPVGRKDMASFTWKRNICGSPPVVRAAPHRQRSADHIYPKEVNPRAKARIVHRNRSADNVLYGLSKAGGDHVNHSMPFYRDERPPTPVKRRTKLRSNRLDPIGKGGVRNVSVGDHRKPPVKQRQLSGSSQLPVKYVGTTASPASCFHEDGEDYLHGEHNNDPRQEELKHPPSRQHRHRHHNHPRPDCPEHPQRHRSKSRPRSLSQSRKTRRPSSRRNLIQQSGLDN
ncbi:hypothetical protein IV203_003898 [Nitzschia inconspicua]|uniref:Uncharacterized protein n=1 Tax=Nitzschia inconspicua TaxID=303405 RepID=A0A9K3L2W2_9STRA|nr:hypothetical protein IV203_003898 [Nitzschia inconspicua]